ncbi:MAG: asparagine synthase-related protein [Spirochaetota bacterium]
MKSPESSEFGVEQKNESEKGYEELFELVRESSVVSEKENKEWSLDGLELSLSDSLKKAGEQSLKDNDGKIFTTLSGGLDSTLALAFLRKNFPNNEIITFAMGGNEDHPDVKHARLAAEKFKSQHCEIIPTPEEINEALREYQEKFPEKGLDETIKEGGFDVYLLYKKIAENSYGPKTVIVHDGIDELMGGYWQHHKPSEEAEQKKVFNEFWQKLIPWHLIPLTGTASSFDINLIFPYLDKRVIKTISEIPIEDRISQSENIGKIPLREIAKKMEVPKEIISRSKKGQQGMLIVNE